MKYAKFIVAAVIAGAIALQTALTDETVSTAEWITVGLAVFGALGVYFVPNAVSAAAPKGDAAPEDAL